jgi:cyclophilin family peptidyl-prolyl cis-trans isomerase
MVAMANSGPNSNASQFFITLAACPSLSGKYVVVGRVVAGRAVLAKIQVSSVLF